MLIIKKFTENRFVRQVAILASGTAVAHLLTIGALPLLTRLYTPGEFGVLGIFVALSSILGVVANWRYEIAIPLPESDERAANLTVVALLCGLITSMMTALVVFAFSDHIAGIARLSGVAAYLWWLPIGVLFTAAYAVFQYWATRNRAFTRIARTRVEQAVGGVGTQLISGWLGFGTIGLILGQVINNGAGFVGLGRRAWRENKPLFASVTVSEMKSVAREYDRFPKYSVVESFANVSAVQIPLILIGSFAASTEVGYLMLGMRLMQAPVGLIGASISQVFFGQAVVDYREGKLPILLEKTLAALLKAGVGPLMFAGIVSPSVFALLFGSEWQRAGELVAWMTPWFILQFLVQPVSMVLHVTSNQRSATVLQVLGFLIRTCSVLLPGVYFSGNGLSISYAVSGVIFYAAYLALVMRCGNMRARSFLASCCRASPVIVFWCVAAAFVVLLQT